MKIATILPIEHLEMMPNEEYNMCLAHLTDDKIYRDFFRGQAKRGNFVLMDNGVVERGVPMPVRDLCEIAEYIGVTEVILPDLVYNKDATLRMGEDGIKIIAGRFDLMAVPQGETPKEWRECLLEMIKWDVRSIGISRFVDRHFTNRLAALLYVSELLESDKEIHLLGCPADPLEIHLIELALPKGRIRGVDSGIAAIYAQDGKLMRDGYDKPDIELDFHNAMIDEDILLDNIDWWIDRCNGDNINRYCV